MGNCLILIVVPYQQLASGEANELAMFVCGTVPVIWSLYVSMSLCVWSDNKPCSKQPQHLTSSTCHPHQSGSNKICNPWQQLLKDLAETSLPQWGDMPLYIIVVSFLIMDSSIMLDRVLFLLFLVIRFFFFFNGCLNTYIGSHWLWMDVNSYPYQPDITDVISQIFPPPLAQLHCYCVRAMFSCVVWGWVKNACVQRWWHFNQPEHFY